MSRHSLRPPRCMLICFFFLFFGGVVGRWSKDGKSRKNAPLGVSWANQLGLYLEDNLVHQSYVTQPIAYLTCNFPPLLNTFSSTPTCVALHRRFVPWPSCVRAATPALIHLFHPGLCQRYHFTQLLWSRCTAQLLPATAGQQTFHHPSPKPNPNLLACTPLRVSSPFNPFESNSVRPRQHHCMDPFASTALT